MKYMDLEKFIDEGYVHEVNRQFFHPLGLALVVSIDEKGVHSLSGIWDAQDDPEGIYFDEETLSQEKVARVQAVEEDRFDDRMKALGYWVQPAPEKS